MKIQVEGGQLICLFLLTLAVADSSQKTKCPFQKLFHFGDGFTDIGNSIHVKPNVSNPARFRPYGITYPGWPTGRWCDGRVDFDYTAIDFGLPNIVPYLTSLASDHNDGVIFSVARSPVLPLSYFEERGIHIPSYAAPLSTQEVWFRKYLNSVCKSLPECFQLVGNALVLMGDIEGNDIGYALTQGKSIKEVKTYVPDIVNEISRYSIDLIGLGAKRIIIPENGPVGCYPYILTALWTTNPTAYDELGCLKSVNNLVKYKNDALKNAVDDLRRWFPETKIYYGSLYDGVRSIIKEISVNGTDGINEALKSCCGIGERYNFDKNRFCGSPGVPVCSNPNEYIYWDGFHFTQQAYYKIEHLLIQPALKDLGCTTSNSVKSYGASFLKAIF